jgi:hypothetical protein
MSFICSPHGTALMHRYLGLRVCVSTLAGRAQERNIVLTLHLGHVRIPSRIDAAEAS